MRKTKKAASSRFRMRKSGSIKRGRPGKRHLLACKTRRRKRHLRSLMALDKADQHRIRELLPHG